MQAERLKTFCLRSNHFAELCFSTFFSFKVLNDLSNKRWNNAGTLFTPTNLARIPRDTHPRLYTFYDLFAKARFAKQSAMQILSMFTYSIVYWCYLSVIRSFSGSSILIVFLDGAARLIVPIIIIVLDFKLPKFTRRIQFLLSLCKQRRKCLTKKKLIQNIFLVLIGIFLTVATILTATGDVYDSTPVTTMVTLAAMIADSVFLINIIQASLAKELSGQSQTCALVFKVTTQRYPTVIRCIAFGCLYGAKFVRLNARLLFLLSIFRHVGTIIAILTVQPLLDSSFPGS